MRFHNFRKKHLLQRSFFMPYIPELRSIHAERTPAALDSPDQLSHELRE